MAALSLLLMVWRSECIAFEYRPPWGTIPFYKRSFTTKLWYMQGSTCKMVHARVG